MQIHTCANDKKNLLQFYLGLQGTQTELVQPETKDLGGLALPGFNSYYLATYMSFVYHWGTAKEPWFMQRMPPDSTTSTIDPLVISS